MSVFIGPRATTSELRSIVPVAGELVYDTNRNIYICGDGSTQGGIPLGGGTGVRLPPHPPNHALVLFDKNGELREGPAPGVAGTFLRAAKSRLDAPEYGPLTLADLPASDKHSAVIVNEKAGGRNTFIERQLRLADIDAANHIGYIKSDGTSFSTIQPDISLFIKIKSTEITTPTILYQLGMNASHQTLLTQAYPAYRIIGTNLKANTDEAVLIIHFQSRMGPATEPQWFAASQSSAKVEDKVYAHTPVIGVAFSGTLSEIILPINGKLLGNTTADSCDFVMDVYHPYDQNSRKPYFISYLGCNETGPSSPPTVSINYGQVAGFFLKTQPITDVKISMRPGEISSGRISLYGLNI